VALGVAACRERAPAPTAEASAPSAVPPVAPPGVEAALRGLDRSEPIQVDLVTDHGTIECALDARLAPRGVALFVGLATGRATWKDPRTGDVSRAPLYRDLTFHRAIAGVMIQSGCPVGDASGYPGYRIEVESSPSDAERLKQPGALVLARYTPPPNRPDPNPPPPGHVLGSQFGVLLRDMSHLAGQVTVLGHCQSLDVAQAIARAFRTNPAPPRLQRVRVHGISP
jgi:peptidyl-prolyl cis-trans isomerase A (cyclophilin A)